MLGGAGWGPHTDLYFASAALQAPIAAASPPPALALEDIEPFGLGLPLGLGSLDEQSLALGDHWWSDILSDGIEQHFAGIGLSAASAPGAAPEPAAQPAGDAAATPAGATPEPHSVRIRQHVAPSRPRYEGQLHTTSRRPAARTQRQRRGPEPAGEPAADTAGAPLEPAIGAPAFRSIQQRPSAVARVVGNGHKGRATKSEAFPWKDARKRMRQLKAMWKAGQLTQAAVAAILRREFNNDRVTHGTVSRRFAKMP
ncbi:hypothetical protein COHA_008538 [Chlorella ohadii]|uniref:Uncharacterized protein n=1 Tax=Chlorella ohadii TaxID=2649997 RepID=A0AAD5DH65_9CHLO|nr:hypothetical protein COHA_008538 [Chlorella ohadii]